MVHKLQSLNYEILPHPPYLPDISPTDYHLFKHFELFIYNKVFLNKKSIVKEFKQFIGEKDDKFFENGIYSLEKCWAKVIDNQGSSLIKINTLRQLYSFIFKCNISYKTT